MLPKPLPSRLLLEFVNVELDGHQNTVVRTLILINLTPSYGKNSPVESNQSLGSIPRRSRGRGQCVRHTSDLYLYMIAEVSPFFLLGFEGLVLCKSITIREWQRVSTLTSLAMCTAPPAALFRGGNASALAAMASRMARAKFAVSSDALFMRLTSCLLGKTGLVVGDSNKVVGRYRTHLFNYNV